MKIVFRHMYGQIEPDKTAITGGIIVQLRQLNKLKELINGGNIFLPSPRNRILILCIYFCHCVHRFLAVQIFYDVQFYLIIYEKKTFSSGRCDVLSYN